MNKTLLFPSQLCGMNRNEGKHNKLIYSVRAATPTPTRTPTTTTPPPLPSSPTYHTMTLQQGSGITKH